MCMTLFREVAFHGLCADIGSSRGLISVPANNTAVQRQNLLCAFFLRMKMFRSEVLVFGVGTATYRYVV